MGKSNRPPKLDELVSEANRLEDFTPHTFCERCGDATVAGHCLKCGGPFERFAATWSEAMETSSQRLDVISVRYLLALRAGLPASALHEELTSALTNWVDARRMKGYEINSVYVHDYRKV